jgi:HAMP domain-containing protein
MLVFIGGILISGAALSRVLQQRAQDEVTSKALILIETMNSVREYTSNNVNPLLSPSLETEPVFIPETVPAFSATEVFANLRKHEEYKSFSYKEATLNPTNLRDKADSFETKLVERFRNESQTKEISDFRTLPVGEVFYIARPLAIKKQSCLKCHSTPGEAPRSHLVTYGAENGFGWKLNEIVAAQIISVPADEVFESTRKTLSLVMVILIGIFATVVLLINFLLKKAVVQPIKKMAKVAQAVSTGQLNSEFEQNSNDEIGVLASAFNRMKSSLEIAMKLLAQKNN